MWWSLALQWAQEIYKYRLKLDQHKKWAWKNPVWDTNATTFLVSRSSSCLLSSDVRRRGDATQWDLSQMFSGVKFKISQCFSWNREMSHLQDVFLLWIKYCLCKSLHSGFISILLCPTFLELVTRFRICCLLTTSYKLCRAAFKHETWTHLISFILRSGCYPALSDHEHVTEIHDVLNISVLSESGSAGCSLDGFMLFY